MTWLARLRIRSRLLVSLVFSVMALAALGAFAAWTIDREATRATAFIDSEFEALQALGALRTYLGDARRYEKEVLLTMGDEAATERYSQQWGQSLAATQLSLAQLQGLAQAAEATALGEMAQRLRVYEAGFKDILGRLARGELHDPWAANAAMAPLAADMQATEQGLMQVSQALGARASERRAALARTGGQAPWVVLVATAVVALLATLLVLAIVRSIVRPMQALQATAKAWGQGDLTATVRAEGRDEIAQVQEDLGRMHAALSQLVWQVRTGVEVVGDNTAEIATANGELSERTERAATALQHTVASVEQLAQAVRHTADSATQAVGSADAAQQVAQRGGEVVNQVVHTMQDINDASRKIADIIAVIDGIAFQTNILALNAAVEAARAGEQGRGFAVVASEVRSLAGRSAQAAREIKAIIHDSVDKVEKGSALAAQAGQTMREMVAGVGLVVGVIQRIRAAAHEQLQGIGAISSAMAGIDQATQQNAAMVEESAAGTMSLAQETQQLRTAVRVFQLDTQPLILESNRPLALMN
ncbi:MAG: hypothetical protein A3E00_02825 [Curvibacter sp. RIFCSPHIGHO2_12_FULL_63_18]|uniref:methyl-accepting chemotaxis protein n=1 Tax=Rhodoferax sp. TaxID=50421 RepID=UPI0008D022CD|nr:methyl-accepting chemotaxis protein [Rhodoferax sp.]OGO99857.1 MAG: hypothetical protein A2037_14380 [Curvibacter sp. GWA2_63_95]OGP06591.1 MAG: hypothetical protein A3E00_02825 [Curvibacter sp. RIFCSPHIGHO2_12_FULL_63_18]HCX82455.1 hypothetical protein [Rhodoferax sp.]